MGPGAVGAPDGAPGSRNGATGPAWYPCLRYHRIRRKAPNLEGVHLSDPPCIFLVCRWCSGGKLGPGMLFWCESRWVDSAAPTRAGPSSHFERPCGSKTDSSRPFEHLCAHRQAGANMQRLQAQCYEVRISVVAVQTWFLSLSAHDLLGFPQVS